MRITAKADYAVRAAIELAAAGDESLTAEAVAARQGIPVFFLRKILSEHLPELVNGYRRVPESLRREMQNGGMTPDQQLAQGLQVIDDEIAEMSAQLAQGDLDLLATRGRYLQIKYQGEGE